MIKLLLDSSNFSEYFKFFNFDENNINNFSSSLMNLSSSLTIQNNEILIDDKEKISKYYILLKGKCKIFEEIKYIEYHTPKEYYLLLIDLLKEGEVKILKNTLTENKNILDIEFKIIDRLNFLLFLNEIKYQLDKFITKYSYILKIFQNYLIDFERFDIKKEVLIDLQNQEDFRKITKYCNDKLKVEFENIENIQDTEKYKIITQNNEKLPFTIFKIVDKDYIKLNSFIWEHILLNETIQEFEKFYNEKIFANFQIKKTKHQNQENKNLELISEENQINGDIVSKRFSVNSLKNNNGKNYINSNENKNDKFIDNEDSSNIIEYDISFSKITIKTESNCEFLFFDKNEFLEIFNLEKNKIKIREMVFLSDNYFFSSISKKVFEKKYFTQFSIKRYNLDNVIFKEDEKSDKLYFVKEGVIEISIHKNVLELFSLVKNLLKYEPQLKNLIDSDVENKIHNQIKDILKDLSIKRKFSIFKFDSKDIIGLESIYLGINTIYQATVVSRKAIIYEINNSTLKFLKRETSEIRNIFDSLALDKLAIFLKRINYLKDIFMRNFDNKITEEQNKIKLSSKLEKNLKKLTKRSAARSVNIISEDFIAIDKYNEIKEMFLSNSQNNKKNNINEINTKTNKLIIDNIDKISENNSKINKLKLKNKTEKKNNLKDLYLETEITEKSIKKLKKIENEIIGKIINNDEDFINPITLPNINEKITTCVIIKNHKDLALNLNNKKKIPEKNNLKIVDFNNINLCNNYQKTKSISTIVNNTESSYNQYNTNVTEPNIVKSNIENNLFKIESKKSNLITDISKKDFTSYNLISENLSKVLENYNNKSENFNIHNKSSSISSANLSFENLESKKNNFDTYTFESSEKKPKIITKVKESPKKDVDLLRFYNNYKSLRKISINFKMEEFFKEGVPLSTKAF